MRATNLQSNRWRLHGKDPRERCLHLDLQHLEEHQPQGTTSTDRKRAMLEYVGCRNLQPALNTLNSSNKTCGTAHLGRAWAM